ncbi:hypothetical protein MN116_003717 [Schistosoma mekongi]|uniref:ApaG domain-containing protein n=1 Tax=Schistosoma mekongi TaxID=38744 RepID=A0AAE2D610_SCHME|nr:hypothetical protein MN116_003717 [Schistosoma mekongi]
MFATCLSNELVGSLLHTFGLRSPKLIFRRSLLSSSRPVNLEPIGHLQGATESAYEPGQIFLHKYFGYRGIVLQCWKGKLFDRNLQSLKAAELTSHESAKQDESEINVYQVLTDQRDIEICNSALKPGITFLPDDKRAFNAIYIVSEMDYVLHDDIIPYIPQDNSPIKNEYLSEFLLCTPDKEPPFIPTDHLRRWIETRKRSLEVTSIHREVTEGIRITVLPFYMGRRTTGDKKENDIRYWRYLIRLESLNMERVQLRERLWKVFSITGNLESNRGKGVVGMPILSPECPVFQYHSHVQVPVPWAHMWGSFRFEKLNGGSLDVKIPSFPLYDRTYWSNSNNKLG